MQRVFPAIGLAFLVGCSDSPPPIAIAPVIEAKAPEFKAPPKPKETDAAAKALLDEVVAAHTLGQPEKIGRLKTVGFEHAGTARGADGSQAQATWNVKYSGKRKCHALVTYIGGATLVSVYNEGRGFFGVLGQNRVPLTGTGLRDVTLQMGEESIMYLFGFDDPAIVAQTATVDRIGDNELLGLHIWTPTVEHLLLSVDAKTKLITRVQYVGSEAGTPTVKDLRITGHREIAGFKLPEKYTVTANGILLFEWEKLTFDPAPVLDPKLFDVP
jgi:hypothetical protein